MWPTDRETLPGAHRGGTHSHQYSRAGRRIGFTYDDALLPQYERTVGYMEMNPHAPGGATHWFAVLVPVVPRGTAKPGEIERAAEDAWVDAAGTKRAFIGRVRNEDGVTYEQSLFVADLPLDVDITTADAGSAQRYPRPPKGVSIRRLTHSFAAGTAYASPDGKRIAYFAHDAQGTLQVSEIPENGSDRARDPRLRPVQLTHLQRIRANSLRWHPSGDALSVVSDGGIAVVWAKPGRNCGRSSHETISTLRESAFDNAIRGFSADERRNCSGKSSSTASKRTGLQPWRHSTNCSRRRWAHTNWGPWRRACAVASASYPHRGKNPI